MTAKQLPGTLLHDGQPLPAFHRLVILVPNADLDEIRLARHIRNMMLSHRADILLLSLVTWEGEESLERRRLTNLAAVLRDPLYTVTSKIISSNHWVGEIQKNLLPGDLLMCLEGQYAPSWGFRSQPVGEALVGRLPYPVYVLHFTDFKEIPRQALSHRLVGWSVSIVVILLFLGFDARIVQGAGGWISTLLLGMSLLVEVGLLWSWNNLWN